jgi:hypothetical protein
MLKIIRSRTIPALLTTMSTARNGRPRLDDPRPAHHRGHGLGARHGLPARGLDLAHDVLGGRRGSAAAVRGAAKIVHDDAGARRGHQEGDLPPDSPAAARDHGNPALQDARAHGIT